MSSILSALADVQAVSVDRNTPKSQPKPNSPTGSESIKIFKLLRWSELVTTQEDELRPSQETQVSTPLGPHNSSVWFMLQSSHFQNSLLWLLPVYICIHASIYSYIAEKCGSKKWLIIRPIGIPLFLVRSLWNDGWSFQTCSSLQENLEEITASLVVRRTQQSGPWGFDIIEVIISTSLPPSKKFLSGRGLEEEVSLNSFQYTFNTNPRS